MEFTAVFNGHYNFVVLDDIAFSTNSVVPEPSTLALMLITGVGFAVRRWRRKGS